ncbi:hypothetical protein E8E12_005186 [Didymella heteroderae]|uniref:Uncharacterized protein n=1 Tax=Didymella heteroderae TaxID=1769908 RepID=A0A9P4WLE4_9PLEO|nr:hypothetical protein E8E12_005186 [Didymella heteroderae]
MPHCAICSTRIYGSGHYCILHKPIFSRSYTQENYNYSSDFTHPGETHFRTSAGTAGTVARRRAHHNNHRDSHNQPYTDTQVVNLPLAQTLTQAFTHLQDAYVIASVTYDGQEITVNANLERERCPICQIWFPDHGRLAWHRFENPA